MAWCTTQDVQNITGKTVEDTEVQQAHFIIEMTSGGTVAALTTTTVSTRNLYWLKLAVAYQTAFMVEHPDFFSRMDVSTYTQDGVSAAIRPDGLVLAPNARRALKRLSWRGMRTIQPQSGAIVSRRAAYTSDDYDDNLSWKQL